MRVRIVVPGPWRPEIKRHRQVGKWQRRVDTPEAKDFKAKVAFFAVETYRGTPLNEPLRATIIWRRPKPDGYRKLENWPWRRPDVTDNLPKIVYDALTGIVLKDDAIIIETHHRKEFGDRWEVEIVLETVCEEWPY